MKFHSSNIIWKENFAYSFGVFVYKLNLRNREIEYFQLNGELNNTKDIWNLWIQYERVHVELG